MTFEEIQKELAALEGAMLDKAVRRPTASMIIKSGRSSVIISTEDCMDGYAPFGRGTRFECFHGDTPRECIAAARKLIAALPDPEIAAKRAWQKKLGVVIDEGNALSLPDEVMKPLQAGSQAMAQNLLTQEAAE